MSLSLKQYQHLMEIIDDIHEIRKHIQKLLPPKDKQPINRRIEYFYKKLPIEISAGELLVILKQMDSVEMQLRKDIVLMTEELREIKREGYSQFSPSVSRRKIVSKKYKAPNIA